MKKNIPLIIILIAGAALLFTDLGNQFLWQDEAETAVLARSVLKYGYPKAFDGTNLVNPTIRTGYGPGYGWRYHPWGQFYITALSFRVLGEGTFTARLPFAFIGLLNILMLYLLALRLTRQRLTAIFAALVMTLSVPYLLMMRQCRYYAPAVFLVLFILFFYHRYLENRKVPDVSIMAAGLALLGYTVHGMFLPVLAAVVLHYSVFRFERKSFLPFLAACGASFMAVLPWFIYSNSGAHVAVITPERIWKNLEFQVRMINKYVFPAFFFAGVYAVRGVWKKRWSISLENEEKETLKLFAAVMFMSMAAFCFAQERNFRYLIYFVPLFAVIQGMILYRLLRFNRILLAAFLAISLFTGFFNMGRPDSYLPKYLYEITHDYDGPVEGMVKFFRANDRRIKDGDTVKISYGDLPLMFYTDLRIDNSRVFDDDHMPEWIVFRRWWDGKESLENDYFRKVREGYKEHVLEYPDIPWENRPGDLGYHRFATDTEAPGVIIFEKKNR